MGFYQDNLFKEDFMKNVVKKFVAMMLAGVMSFSLMACGGSGSGAAGSEGAAAGEKAGKHATIGVAFYQDSGLATTAAKAYLDNMAETLNCDFKYTVLSQTDEGVNLTKIQELIASGVDGIICTMDSGMAAIVQECEAAGVYIGGYLCDYDISYTQSYDAVFKSDNFVGTAIDGYAPDNVVVGKQMFESLLEYNERNADAPITHVSLAIFPVWAFPAQTIAAQQFLAEVEEYNKTAEVQITCDPLDEETDVLAFSPMDSTYFAKHEGIQAIMSFAAGTGFVYPVMVQTGNDKNIKLFTTGFDGGEEKNFGSAGTGTYQQNCVTPIESITYPLVLLLNKINGAEFADMPEDAERVSCDQFIMNSDEDMAAFQKNIYFTANASDALFTPEQVLNMTAYANPDATYEQLKKACSTITVDTLK